MKKHIKLINLLLFSLLVCISSCKNGICEEKMYLQTFNFDANLQPIDVNVNNLHGDIRFFIKNIPQDVNEIFIYVDDVEIADWVRYLMDEGEIFGFESNRFSNGPHKIKLESIKSDRSKEYLTVNSDFDNLISNVSADEGFYPTEDYHYRGLNRDGNPLKVTLIDSGDKERWSKTYSDVGDVNIVIPRAAFRDRQIFKLLITDTVTGKNCEENLLIAWKEKDFMGDCAEPSESNQIVKPR